MPRPEELDDSCGLRPCPSPSPSFVAHGRPGKPLDMLLGRTVLERAAEAVSHRLNVALLAIVRP
jgi:hypothetical protein